MYHDKSVELYFEISIIVESVVRIIIVYHDRNYIFLVHENWQYYFQQGYFISFQEILFVIAVAITLSNQRLLNCLIAIPWCKTINHDFFVLSYKKRCCEFCR